MTKGVFAEFNFRFKAWHASLAKELGKWDEGDKNLSKTIGKPTNPSLLRALFRASSKVSTTEKLRKITFPKQPLRQEKLLHFELCTSTAFFQLNASLGEL